MSEGSRRSIRLGALGVAAATVMAILVVDAAVVELRAVDSDSMSPTLLPSERVVVVKAGVDRSSLPIGAIVVFDAADLWAEPDDPSGTVFVKRIVGAGGDRITCCDADGRILRNGSALSEEYLDPRGSEQQRFDVRVQPGHYWLLGDNRAGSADSRAHLGDPGGGNVPASRIIGTVEAVAWPPGSIRRVEDG